MAMTSSRDRGHRVHRAPALPGQGPPHQALRRPAMEKSECSLPRSRRVRTDLLACLFWIKPPLPLQCRRASTNIVNMSSRTWRPKSSEGRTRGLGKSTKHSMLQLEGAKFGKLDSEGLLEPGGVRPRHPTTRVAAYYYYFLSVPPILYGDLAHIPLNSVSLISFCGFPYLCLVRFALHASVNLAESPAASFSSSDSRSIRVSSSRAPPAQLRTQGVSDE
jgi:hypothetical protein